MARTEDEKYTAVWWTTPFGAWVCEFGTGKLRTELQVTKSAVHSWVRGIVLPRPAKALRMVELAGGKLTVDQIYQQPATVAKLVGNVPV